MRLISNEVENYGNTPVEWWLTAFYTGRNLEKDSDGVLYRFHLSHNDLDGLACHVVSTVYDCALNRFEIPLVDLTDALQYKNWEEVHVAHQRMPIQHSICEAGAKNVKEALHQIFESCCRSVFYKPVGPKDQIILLITDLGGITNSMFDEFYEAYGDRFQAIVIDHHLSTTPDRGKCDPNQIFWYVTGYQEGNLQSATKNLFTATCGSYNAAHPTSTTSGRASKKQERFVKQLTEYVEAVSKYDTGRWGEWLDRKTPDDVDLSVQHQLFFNNISWDSSADIFRRVLISKYVQDMIYLLSTEDYVHTNRAYWEIVRGNLNKLHKEFYDMRQLTLAYNPHLTLTLKIDPIDGVYNPATRHMIRLGDITTNVQPVNNRLHPLVTFGIIELSKDQSQTKEWKYFSLCSRELMKKYKLDLFILVDEPNGTVSLRSMNNHGFEINCADIARHNGGGGHKRAAGYPIPKVEVPEDDDTDTEEYDAEDAEDWEDDTEEAEDDGTEEANADDSSEDSGEELVLNAYPPIGTNVHWAGHNWIVSHVTSTEVYLTLNGIDGKSTWDNLQNACTTFANSLTEAQKACLKSVTAGNTSGKVFVATKDQMDGGFSYFNSNSRRSANNWYWTSTETNSDYACSVLPDGSLYDYGGSLYDKLDSDGFRPSVCIDLTLHNSGDSEGSDDSSEDSEEELIPNSYPFPIGTRMHWAGYDWIVSHVELQMLYLTLADIVPDWNGTWDNLQDACTTFANKFTEAQKECLKSVTAGNTSGKVFVATKDQMDGGFSYFNSNSRRTANNWYWTSTEAEESLAWGVDTVGSLGYVNKSNSLGFRPSVCIELNLNIGNTVTFAGKQWVVSHRTADSLYLTLNGVLSDSTWDDLQNACTNFENSLTEAQKKCLKSVTAGNTNGKVFVATRDQMDGGFNYFNSNSHRRLNEVYWTSTEYSSDNAWSVITDGSLDTTYAYFYHVAKSDSNGFRPSVCVDLTLRDSGDSGESDEPKLNPELPDMSSLTIGNTVMFVDKEWIVSHETADTFYLTLKGVLGNSTWYDLQENCTAFENSLSEAQRRCLKHVTAGNTSGKVFVATKDQMNGDFSYFDSDCRCSVRDVYWTSTEKTSRNAWGVDSDGCLGKYSYDKSNSIGFRPSIAISTKEFCNNHDISDELDDSEEENSDEELVPVMDLNKAIRWAGINWRPLQQDDDLLYLTPYEPTDDLKLCTFSELEDVAAEWGAKHLSDSDQSALVPIQINGKSYNVAPITLEHILNIPDARNAKYAQISMPYGNVPYWTGSSAYKSADTDDMVWCMNEKGQNVPVNKDAFLAFRPMICLHITNALVGNLDDEKPIVLTHNIPNAYPSAGTHVYWAGNDWIIAHVDLKMVYMTLADVVPEWKVVWNDLQDTCYEWAKKTFSTEELKKLVPITCGNTHGKVWVASKRLMGTGLAYFAESEEHRAASCRYWTSTEYSNVSAWNVDANGDIFNLNGVKTCQHGFRPSICMLRSNFGPEDRTVGHYENAEIVNGCRTLIATGMQVMWANQRWIVSNIQPEIVMLTLAHSIPDLMDWEDLQDACNAWGNENLGDQKSKLAYLLVGGICGKVFVATKSDMDSGFDYFTDDDKRCLGECYWTSTKDADGTVYYVDETGKIQSVSGQAMCLDTAPKFTFRPTVAIWTKEFCNDQGVKVVSE